MLSVAKLGANAGTVPCVTSTGSCMLISRPSAACSSIHSRRRAPNCCSTALACGRLARQLSWELLVWHAHAATVLYFGSARREAAVRSGLSCAACSNGGDARLLIRRLAQRRPRLPPSILSRPLPFCLLLARAACHGRRAADGTVMPNAQWPAAALRAGGSAANLGFEMIELHQNLNSH